MSPPHGISAELVAVIVAVTGGEPRVLTLSSPPRLPSGPFSGDHRSLQAGMRNWIERQTGLSVGYVEQLYTFADSDRLRPSSGDDGGLGRVISVTYLALAREDRDDSRRANWRDWYAFFPWEDRRRTEGDGWPDRLLDWAERPGAERPPGLGSTDVAAECDRRRARISAVFGAPDGAGWNEELALARYELLFEAGLVAEAGHASGAGRPMAQDHRRILATAIARLRAKVKYRALVFELMPDAFTLLDLQRTMEALAGRLLHKQNFRRLIAQQDLIEETGAMLAEQRGRPAKLFRFRGAVLAERRANTTRLPIAPGG